MDAAYHTWQSACFSYGFESLVEAATTKKQEFALSLNVIYGFTAIALIFQLAWIASLLPTRNGLVESTKREHDLPDVTSTTGADQHAERCQLRRTTRTVDFRIVGTLGSH